MRSCNTLTAFLYINLMKHIVEVVFVTFFFSNKHVCRATGTSGLSVLSCWLQIPNHVAIKIALELKKLLVDNSLLDVYASFPFFIVFPYSIQIKRKLSVASLYYFAALSLIWKLICLRYAICSTKLTPSFSQLFFPLYMFPCSLRAFL